MHWITFLGLAAVIVTAGRFLARDGDILAEKSGMGRTWVGAILVAATTSLPELFAGIGAAAVFQLPEIAVGDVLGSCMFNLLILSLMDAVGGKTPLSSRASPSHALALGFGTMMMGIVGLGVLVRDTVPELGWIGWSTPVAVVMYLIAARTMFQHEKRVRKEHAEEALLYSDVSLKTAALRYAAAAAVVVTAAIFLPDAGAAIAEDTGLDQGFVGTVFIAVATSLPEVAVSLAAVRMGSIDLAVGNVLGSNLFNVLILAFDDVLYRGGPILTSVHPKQAIAVLAVLAMNGVVLVGLIYQATHKRLVLAWDTFGIAVLYLVTLTLYAAA